MKRLLVLLFPLILAACTNSSDPGNLPHLDISLYQGAGRLGGEQVTLAQVLKQGKPVVLNFWAGQCPPCRAEMPDFERLSKEYQDRVLLVGVDVGPFTGLGSRDDGRALLRQLNITYPAGTTFDQSVLKSFGVRAMPTTITFRTDGTVVTSHSGILVRSQMVGMVEDLLKASQVS